MAILLLAAFLTGCSGRALPATSTPPPANPAVPAASQTAGPVRATEAEGQATARPIARVAADTTDAAPPSTTPSATPSTPILKRTHNILVLGVDHRPWDPDPAWRTDTIMVLAIDEVTDRVGVISIPRDLYLDVPGLGKARINQVDYYGESTKYPGGGPALLRRVLTETLDLPVQDYVRMQMAGLVRLVDALGGVTVTLECPLYERTPDDQSPNGVKDWTLPAGEVYLNGEEAKKFATYRYVTTDFGRAQRQQQLIWAMRNRALQVDAIPKVPALWSALRETFVTDLGLIDTISLARLGTKLKPENVRGLVWSTDVLEYYWTEAGAVVLVIKDRDKMLDQLAHLFDSRPLAELGRTPQTEPGGGCPPPPTAVPAFTATPQPTPTITATAQITGTVTVAPPALEGTPEGTPGADEAATPEGSPTTAQP